LIIKAFVRLGF